MIESWCNTTLAYLLLYLEKGQRSHVMTWLDNNTQET